MTQPTPLFESAPAPCPALILVTGDVVRDIFIYQGDRIYPTQPGKITPHFSDRPGGARGLYELLVAVRPDAVHWGLQYPIRKNALQPVHVLWTAREGGTKRENEDAAKDDKPAKVWRVEQPLGYALTAIGPRALPKAAVASERHAVIVIDDAGLGFRTLPANASWPLGIAPDETPPPAWIVHKMANPIAQGDLWRALIGGSAPAPRKNLLVIVAADELRRAGAAISRGFSWERTLAELCAELNHNPVFQPLLRFPHRLIVSFGCVGAVWFGDSCDPKRPNAPAQDRARLVYDPTLPEGGWKTLLADDHGVYGNLNAFTAAIALAAAEAPSGIASNFLDAAITRGLAACRQLRLLGHGKVSDVKPGPPFGALAPLLSPLPADPNAAKVVNATLKTLLPQGVRCISGACGRMQPDDAATWTLAALAENPPDQPQLPLYGLAHRVSLYGYSALEHIPHAHFGVMLSVDRQEIETLRSLTHLIQSYEREKLPKQPLSIAAFGPPGAGKSFGIKQIAHQVLGKGIPFENFPILEFNLSQFDNPADLFGAFHQVRDRALKGITPVVFWDEFDSREYKWLQYLLAPMQDGTFEENGHTHAIGKCIFVFAGATSWDFKHFGPAPMPEGWKATHGLDVKKTAQEEGADPKVKAVADRYVKAENLQQLEAAAHEEFRRKKGPDFLSRLDGHIDVLGPNQHMLYNWTTRSWDNPDPHDITFPIRRALLLRQFLGAKKPKDTLAIDRDLLRAFLHVRRYRHGVRSLEKIARYLALSQPPFCRAHLPPPQVLAQHLDTAGDFDRIYQETQRLLTPETIDALARAINEGYNLDNPSPWNKAFKDLDAFLQQSNRAAALRIPHILALAGLRLTLCQPPRPTVNLDDPLAVKTVLAAPLTAEEEGVFNHLEHHIEDLAEEEHRLWMQFHLINGWSFGYREETKPDPSDPAKTITTFEKDKANLKHPCMASFHEMPDDHGQRKTWQDYDRNAIRRYPRLVRLTEFTVAFTAP